ncbi:L-type lectin-domain containing receptor kinase IV.1 [Camellia lanceoleosa]|uniref:L-type lectin-domain containing receptor kinase IV.1 n=1 Tax=Camellia lanceoleosa TaxID=1840588 RepID=A0ACC0HJP6_9ERIC|nr:L-type lectin-domain containing receptor kinase IV.1 [Camellia lanceoleosa]
MQVWVDYDGVKKQMNVTMASINTAKPRKPLCSMFYDLSSIVNETMYVGFSSSTGSVETSHYVLGWSFQVNGEARALDLSRLPKLPRIGPKKISKFLTIGLPIICLMSVFGVMAGVVFYVRRKRKFAEVLEDWELAYGPHRFKLYDHGTDPQTTHVVGTLGYLAPEHTRTGKATTSTDVYAFGAFLLEMGCGRRPIEPSAPIEHLILVDWVFSLWSRGEIFRAIDPKLGSDYVAEEVELVLKLGLLCSHSEPAVRPSMRQIVQFLEGDVQLPELTSLEISATGLTFAKRERFDDFAISYPSSMEKAFSQLSSVAESLLSGGR